MTTQIQVPLPPHRRPENDSYMFAILGVLVVFAAIGAYGIGVAGKDLVSGFAVINPNIVGNVVYDSSSNNQVQNSGIVNQDGCSDSDSGLSTSVRGVTTGVFDGINNARTDYCHDEKTLVEFYCNNGVKSDVVICPNSCNDGQCV